MPISINILTHWLPTTKQLMVGSFYYDVDYKLSCAWHFQIYFHLLVPAMSSFAVILLVWKQCYDFSRSYKSTHKKFLLSKLAIIKLALEVTFRNWPQAVNVLMNSAERSQKVRKKKKRKKKDCKCQQ